MNENFVAKRRFGMGQKDNKTKIYVTEFLGGAIGFQLITDREGLEPLSTSFILSPSTLNLLSDVMNIAAHDSSIWENVDER